VNKKEKGENKMKPNAKFMSILMIATMLLGFAAIALPVRAATANVYVDPTNNIFPPPSLAVGSTFMVNVTIQNVTAFAGVGFDLSWNATLLQCNSMTEVLYHTVTPSAKWSNIWDLGTGIDNTLGIADYAVTWQNMGKAQTDGYAPANVTTPIPIATLIFQVLVSAPHGGSVSCPLALSNVKIGDIGGVPIQVTTADGVYQLNYVPPSAKPFYTVLPATYTANTLGEIFSVSVYVNNLDPNWMAVGFEFKLSYNASLLTLLNVTFGPWLPPYGVAPNQGTLNLTNFGANYAQIGQVVLPDVNGTWHAPYPSAPNPNTALPMATIFFQAIAQQNYPTILSCPLHLYDTKVGDSSGAAITVDTPVDGTYSMNGLLIGRQIDIFVGQNGIPYPKPYGGQGPNAPADMFWPQKQVCVWANVTYNGWPEQQKDVAFQIIDNLGNTWGVIYARTDANGIATTCFRLPWPCNNPEQYIGVWTIVGTVDVACNIVNDTVRFHYDYLVQIWKVTTDKTSYAHLDTINVTVSYGSQAQQTYPVILTGTGLDNTGVPFNFAYVNTTIGGTIFCQYKNFTTTYSLTIPKFARAGLGEVDTAFLDNWPFLGGTVQSGYATGTVPPYLGYCPTPISILAK